MKHIALLLPDLEVGGAQRVMLMLAREFVRSGHTVDLLVFHVSGQLREHIPGGVRLVNIGGRRWLPTRFGIAMRSIVHLASWLRRHRPDVLLSTVTGANLVAILARRISGVANCLVIREAVTLDNVRTFWRLRAMHWLYPQADAVIALSSVIAEQMASRLGVSHQRIHHIPNPVDIEYIRKQAGMAMDHPWFSDGKARVLVSVGRLIPQKDYVTLLRAFSIASRTSNLRLIIVGEGPLRPMLEVLIAELELSNTCQLVGFDSNPWRWMARGDLYVLSSRWEGHPNALLEAVALGIPAIVTAYDESVFQMAEQLQFAVVLPGDFDAMAQAMLAGEKALSRSIDPTKLCDPTSVATKYMWVFNDASTALHHPQGIG